MGKKKWKGGSEPGDVGKGWFRTPKLINESIHVWEMFDHVLSLGVPSPPGLQPSTVCMGADPVPGENAGNKHRFSGDGTSLS